MPGKRSSRTTKTSLPAKMQKTSITSSPADESTKLGAPAKTQVASVTSTDPDVATPKREPKTVPRSDGDNVTAKKLALPTSSENDLPDVKEEDKAEDSDDDDWTTAFSTSRKVSTADPSDPKSENFYKDLKLHTVAPRYVRSPEALVLKNEVILDGCGGTWGCYKLTFMISRSEGEDLWKVGCALGKAQYRILKIMAKRRGIKDKIYDKRRTSPLRTTAKRRAQIIREKHPIYT